jgi:hypothetical protein
MTDALAYMVVALILLGLLLLIIWGASLGTVGMWAVTV